MQKSHNHCPAEGEQCMEAPMQEQRGMRRALALLWRGVDLAT